MGWQDFALQSMQNTNNQKFSPEGTYNAFYKGADDRRAEEAAKLAAQKEGAAYQEDQRNKSIGEITRIASSMKNNTPQYRASIYPQVRNSVLKLMPELEQMMPAQWDEKYLPELDSLIAHGSARQTSKPELKVVGENDSLYNADTGTFVGGTNGGIKKPKRAMVSVPTTDANGMPVTRQVMRMEIPEIGGYWVDGFIVNPQYPNGISAESYMAQHGKLPDQYMIGMQEATQGSQGAPSQSQPVATAPAAPAASGARTGASVNPAAKTNAQGFAISGNEPPAKPTAMPPTYAPPTERKRGALPLPQSAPPPQLQIAPDVDEPMTDEMSRQPIQAAPERGLPFKPSVGRAYADEFAPQGMNAMARGMSPQQNAMRPPAPMPAENSGGGNALAYPRYQAPTQPQKTSMGDLWVKAAMGDPNAKAAVMNAEEIKAALKGKAVKQATLDKWAETRGNHAMISTTLDEVREFRQKLQRGEFSMNMLSRGIGAVRSVFNDSPDTYVQGSMLNAALQDMVNARLMANKGVQTDGDAQRAREAMISVVDSNDDKTIIAALIRAEKYLKQSQDNFGRAYRQTEQQYPMLKSIQ